MDRPAREVYRHNLTSIVDKVSLHERLPLRVPDVICVQAVRASNAQYENPDVLKRLGVRVHKVAPLSFHFFRCAHFLCCVVLCCVVLVVRRWKARQAGKFFHWIMQRTHHSMYAYTHQTAKCQYFCLQVVFTARAMDQYLTVFNFLWRIKRVENALAEVHSLFGVLLY